MTHTKNNIIQYNEYYPFGLQTATSWTRENNTGNNFLANGGTELNNTSSLYDLEYRNYDPVLGRMHQVDPMAAKYSSLTPYNFSFNDPVAFTDPDGANPVPGEPDHVRTDIGSLYYGRAVTPRLYYGQGVFGHHITPGSGGNWTDGIGFSDWSLYGGSQMYQDGLAAGYTDLGGTLYQIDADGTRNRYGEENGRAGLWVDTGFANSYTDLGTVTQFVPFKGGGDDNPWFHFFADHNPGGDFLYEVNKINPIAQIANSISAYINGVDTYGLQMSKGEATIGLATILPIFRVGKIAFSFGAYKSATKWLGQMGKRGWSEAMVQEALQGQGQIINSVNYINPGNPLRLFVHPTSNRGVIVDDVTKEIIQLTDDLATWKF